MIEVRARVRPQRAVLGARLLGTQLVGHAEAHARVRAWASSCIRGRTHTDTIRGQ